MKRNRIASLALVAAALAAAGCREAVAPASSVPAVPSLSRAGLKDSLDISASAPVADSVAVTFPGVAPAALANVHWSVGHGGAPWVTLLTTSGSGDGVVRWSRDPSDLGYGTWVDTITVTSADGGTARAIDSLTVGGAPPAFITQKRFLGAAQRDSMISFVTATNAGGPYTYALAQVLANSDSISVVVPNPAPAAARGTAATPPPSRLAHLGQAGQTWTLIPLQIHLVFPDSTGSPVMDSLTWLGVFWYASPESTWIGQVIAATPNSKINKTAVNTTGFDASGGKSGVGGGEARASTGNYWEANSGKLWISSNVCSPSSCANHTFTAGPWQGGQWHGILMGGQLISVVAPCLLPSGCTAPPETFNLNFGTGPVGPTSGLYINCIFPTPCTGPPAARLVALLRRGVPLTRALLMDVASPAREEKHGEVMK